MIIESSFKERAINEANFIISNNATLRDAEKYFGVSRSTINRDVTIRLMKIDVVLAQKVRTILDINKADSRNRANAIRIAKAKKKRKNN